MIFNGKGGGEVGQKVTLQDKRKEGSHLPKNLEKSHIIAILKPKNMAIVAVN